MDENEEYLITTIDNPWNPFTHPSEWSEFDREHGYNTRERLATYIFTSNDLGENETAADISFGQKTFLEKDLLGIWIRVKKDTDIKPVNMNEYLHMIGADI